MLTTDELRGLASGAVAIGVRQSTTGAIGDPPWREPGAPASEARRAEFALGRAAAQQALIELGAAAATIPVGAAGEPVWPEGIVGSIAHTAGVAVAVVGWRRQLAGIGIDIEAATRRVGERTLARVCTPAELEWVNASSEPGLDALRIFCAKEALYKALSLKDRTDLGFHDVELAPAASGLLWGEILGDAVPPAPRRFAARTLIADAWLLSCVELPSGDHAADVVGRRR